MELRYKKPVSGRRNATNSLGDIIEKLIDTYKLRGKYNETMILAKWEELVGAGIANRTTKLYFSEKKLYIQLNSAPLRNELLLAKTKFIEMLNKELKADVVSDIIFI